MSDEVQWSYLVDAEEIEGKSLKLHVEADEAARALLMKRLGLLALDVLSADIVLKREPHSPVIHVQGKLESQLAQKCVVSLDPVSCDVAEEFEAWYAAPHAAVSLAKIRHDRQADKNHGEAPILEEHEDPEPLVDGKIDLAELITQYLSLALDPYPHAEGVEGSFSTDNEAGEEAFSKNPFAALKNWKGGKEG